MAEEETDVKKDTTWNKAQNDSRAIHEKVRFAPIHGPTPVAPELEAKKGSAGLILGLAGTALGAANQAGAFKAPAVEDTTWASDLSGERSFGLDYSFLSPSAGTGLNVDFGA